ncbi:MBL fold metallo-hydrolase [Bacillus solimangrovi]|uniref:Metallo-beta-lactamase domain-containing protein n=1 Tax=Bacillus solimangrovi TaxID=1305675 RepID=A0A1E5LKE0_9BACI|nr:MBL fold metallo-hydrolase [Bacillus solimangrovi]OEH94544.1 hypothetical protein BFG57_07695 [Bacillus solimangrovi]
METLQQTKDIHRLTLPTPFTVGPVNVYLVKGEKLTLIDVGPNTKEAKEALITQLDELGYDLLDIEQVVLTHHHPDHTGLLELFSAHADIVGHRRNEPWISRDEDFINHIISFFKEFLPQQGITGDMEKWIYAFFNNEYLTAPVSLTHIIRDGDEVPGMSGWIAYEAKGHAQSHLVFYRESDGVLLGGDHIIGHISSNPLLEPPYFGETERPRPLLQYNEALRKCLKLDISVVYSGHGKEVRNIAPLLERRFERQKQRAEKVLGYLKEQPMTAFEISKKLFPAVYMSEMMLTMSETIAQLDYLEYEGLLTIDKSDVSWKYGAK